MTKISAMPSLTAVEIDGVADLMPIVDMSLAGDSRNKKITIAELAASILALNTPTVGFVAGVSLAEGSGTTNFVFTVTRAVNLTGASSVQWAVTGSGGSPANATDFVGGVLPSGTINFPVGSSTQTVTVSVAGDSVVEPDENFTVTLSSPVNALITAATATGTIINDDSAPVGINSILIEGDSITTTAPAVAIDSYAWRWVNANPTKTINVRAQGSRGLGAPANLDDLSNMLWGHRSQDAAYNAQLWTILIGANDLQFAGSGSAYFDRLKAYIAPIRAAGTKVAFCTVMPFDSAHSAYVQHNTYRDALNALMYSNTSELADYIIPLGEIPEMNTGVNPNPGLTDGVHPSPAGITWLAEVYAAVMDALIAGTVATTPSGSAWFGPDITNSAQNAVYTLRYCVRGLTPGTTQNLAITGTGARFLVGRGAYGTTSVNVRNGDIVLLEVTASSALSTNRAFSITIGTSTQTLNLTTAAVAPATTTFSPTLKHPGVVLSSLNRVMDGNGAGGAYAAALSTTSKSTGKWKIELTPQLVANSPFIGFAPAGYDYTQNTIPGKFVPGVAFIGDTAWYNSGSSTYLAAGFGSSNVPQTLFLDADASKCWLAVNGAIVGGGSPAAGTGGIPTPAGALRAFGICRTASDSMKINAGQEAMAISIAGFLDWG